MQKTESKLMLKLSLYLLIIFSLTLLINSILISQTKLEDKQIEYLFSDSDNNLVILILHKKLSENKIEDISLIKDFANKNKHILFFEIDCNNNKNIITNFLMDNDFTVFFILSNTIVYIYPDDTHNKSISQIFQKLSPKLVQIEKKHKQSALHKKIDRKNDIGSGTYVLQNYMELINRLNSIDYDNIFQSKKKFKKSDIITLPDGRTIFNHETERFEEDDTIDDEDEEFDDDDEDEEI